jgi:hypothetical protein
MFAFPKKLIIFKKVCGLQFVFSIIVGNLLTILVKMFKFVKTLYRIEIPKFKKWVGHEKIFMLVNNDNTC